jgi:hypothetical protein
VPDFGISAFISGFVSGFSSTFGVGTASVGVGFGGASVGAAAAGVAAGGWVAGALISIAVSAVAMKALAPSLGDIGGQMSFGITPTPTKKFVYGKTRVGADVPFITTGKWYYGPYGSYAEKKSEDYNLHMVCEVAGHPIESFDKVWAKDEQIVLKKVVDGVDDPKDLYPDQSSLDRNGVQRWIPDGGSYKNRMMMKFYTGEQTIVDADLFDGCNLPSSNDIWTADHIGKGKAYVYIKMHYDPDQFTGGIPHFSFEVTGKNDIRDPRCDVDFTADHTTETFTATGHGMSDGDVVQVTTDGTLPTGLTADTNYYVINKTDNTFQLSATRGGSVRTITDNGTGTHTVDHQGGYRDNTALCLADYLTESREKGGLGETYDQIDETTLNASANVCDEDVEVYDSGVNEARYFIGGSLDTASKPADILTEFLVSMAGWMERVNGKWQINAGAYTPPAMTITESELVERPLVRINRPYKDIYNSITPQLRSATTEWQPGVAESIEAITKFQVTPDHTTETFTASGHGRSNGDRVKFTAWTGTAVDNDNLPTDIIENTFYYIVNATTNTFQVSLTKGGTVATFSSNGTGTIVAHYDNYLSLDTERKKQDAIYSLITSQTLARRLSLISLLQMRQEIATTVKMKMGTAFACPFDLVVGDTVRWIDAHKSFWEYTGTAVSAGTNSAGTITSVAHGLSNGDPLVITDSDDTGWTEAFPCYVINRTDDTFQIATYRGGSALTTDASYPVQYRTIQGKLFRVNSWKFIADGGNLAVEVGLNETATDLYNWDSGYEVAPTTASSITVRNPINVETPTNLTATSGTNVLYTRQDGTIGTRVKLTWDEPDDAYIQWGGYAEIEYRPSPDITFTADHTTETFTATAHGFSDNDEVQVITSGTLPDGLVADKYYYINSSTANTFKLVEYRGSTTAVTIDDNGTGTHTVIPYEDDTWNTAGQTVGRSQEAFVTDVQDGADYDFRVKFKNGMGNYGDYAQILSHTVVGKTAAPGAPTGVSASTTNSTHIAVTWTDPTDVDLSHIEIHRDNGTGYTLFATVSAGTGVFDDTLVTITTGPPQTSVRTYGYKLKAVDTTGNKSSFTSAVNGSISNNAEPTSLTLNVPGSLIYISYTIPTGEYQKVKAYYRTDTGDPFEWYDDIFRNDTTNNETKTLTKAASGETMEFRLTTVDENGREGTAAEIDYTIP